MKDNPHWIEEDFSNWDGIRVATYPGYQEQTEAFVYYAMVNDFTYELISCDSYEAMIAAVQTGQADAMIQSDISLTDGFRIVGRFSPTPYYFALSPDNTELQQQLNAAMRSLNSSQPNLQTELYDLHFRYTNGFHISQEHQEYIQSLGTLKVLFIDGDTPYQYIRDGKLTGYAAEYLERFAEMTGLQYEAVIAHTYREALPMVERGEVDLVACIPTNSTLSSLDHVRFTAPYFNSFSVSVCSNPNPHKHPADLEFRINTELALSDVQDREEYGIRADYYALSYYLRKGDVYNRVVVDWANTKNFSYAMGVTSSVPQELVTILNQYASSMSSEDRQAMLYRYSGDPVEYTIWEWLLAYRSVLLVALLIVFFVAGILLIYLRSKRMAYKALLAENRIMHLTMYDDITGAYNEPYFRKLLDECCQNRAQIALVAFNIRGFKYINDTYGTKRADDVLCCIKYLLESEMGDGEFFCRPSADLFYMVLREPDADRLTLRLSGIFSNITAMVASTLDGHPLSLYSGAVFVAHSPTPYHVSTNMSYMMVALAHAKQVNPPTVYIFDEPLYQAEQLRYYIETHMHAALVKEEYQLYLQPKINLHTGHVDGAEALVRWQSADRGMIYPDQFIPLFEENGFCVQLDLYMVEQVCKQLRFWMDHKISPLVISVNQTKSLFVKEDYVERLLAITEKYRISPRYLILEILEGLAFENLDILNGTIQKLSDAGFRVSMDDFGSGYSSLNTLGKLKIDELKLDRMFLLDVVKEESGSQSEVLACVFALAKKLGIKTVAEGVETQENEAMMRSMSCDYGQGFYYSRPIPAEEFQKKYLLQQS